MSELFELNWEKKYRILDEFGAELTCQFRKVVILCLHNLLVSLFQYTDGNCYKVTLGFRSVRSIQDTDEVDHTLKIQGEVFLLPKLIQYNPHLHEVINKIIINDLHKVQMIKILKTSYHLMWQILLLILITLRKNQTNIKIIKVFHINWTSPTICKANLENAVK